MTDTQPPRPSEPDHTPAAGPGTPPSQTSPADPTAAPQAWAWAAPTAFETRETEPLEYHRLFRGAQGYRWWKPLVAALLALVCFFLLSLIVGLALGAVLFAVYPWDEVMQLVGDLAIPDTQKPLSIVIGLTTVIVTMVPSVWFSMWVVGLRPISRSWSVALRLRWRLVGHTAWIAVLTMVLMSIVDIGVGLLFLTEDPAAEPAQVDVALALWSMLFVLLLVPFQATAEELVFRGLGMQVVGAWLRNPWFAILIPALGFALAHAPTYGVWGMASVGAMGVVAAWLTWRTGGLEAAISLHIVNNLIAFGIMSTGIAGSTDQNDDAASPLGLIGQAVGFAFFVWMTLHMFKRGGYGRSRIDLIRVAVPGRPPVPPVYAPPISAPPVSAQAPPDRSLPDQSLPGQAEGQTDPADDARDSRA